MVFLQVVVLVGVLSGIAGIPDLSCTDCQNAIEQFLGYVSQLNSEGTVVNLLETEVCSRIEGDLQKTCGAYVRAIIPLLLDYIEDNITPDDVCAVVDICSDSSLDIPMIQTLSPFIVSAFNKTMEKMSTATDLCEQCTVVVNEIHDFIIQEEVQNTLKQPFKEFCDMLPFGKVECAETVDSYADSIFAFLEDYLTQNEVCILLDLCVGADQTP
eukprot:TRINITY_DN2981_c0_g1_i1.p1 TRINITY_DN2981_c0_g1~~TRINITY_DN2981_c0_g1_i1.p1  ORF type:complete len:213 (-),score=11.60 TRINITY_DN2981_c0_g1_i1:408-1046(-)